MGGPHALFKGRRPNWDSLDPNSSSRLRWRRRSLRGYRMSMCRGDGTRIRTPRTKAQSVHCCKRSLSVSVICYFYEAIFLFALLSVQTLYVRSESYLRVQAGPSFSLTVEKK